MSGVSRFGLEGKPQDNSCLLPILDGLRQVPGALAELYNAKQASYGKEIGAKQASYRKEIGDWVASKEQAGIEGWEALATLVATHGEEIKRLHKAADEAVRASVLAKFDEQAEKYRLILQRATFFSMEKKVERCLSQNSNSRAVSLIQESIETSQARLAAIDSDEDDARNESPLFTPNTNNRNSGSAYVSPAQSPHRGSTPVASDAAPVLPATPRQNTKRSRALDVSIAESVKRPRTRNVVGAPPHLGKTENFDQVYRDGNATLKRQIVPWEGDFYYVSCEEHHMDFLDSNNVVNGARTHFSRIHKVGDTRLTMDNCGVKVSDCTLARAIENNKVRQLAIAAYRAHRRNRPRKQQVTIDKVTPRMMNKYKVTEIIPGQSYLAFIGDAWRPAPSVALPTSAAVASLGLDHETASQLTQNAPACILYDAGRDEFGGWAPGYQDGQDEVKDRAYPMLGFGDKGEPIVGWISLKSNAITPFANEDNNSSRPFVAMKEFRSRLQSANEQPQRPTEPPTTTQTATTSGTVRAGKSTVTTQAVEERGEPSSRPAPSDDPFESDSDDDLPAIDELLSSPAKSRSVNNVASRATATGENTSSRRSETADVRGSARRPSVGQTSRNPITAIRKNASWMKPDTPPLGRAVQANME